MAIDHRAVEIGESLTDRDLLRRFAVDHDEEAFATLVARHGRMVLGVCHRFLPTVQDAEDACQATFLILARKAGGRWQPSVANWLHTTARRVAAKARRVSARRVKREGGAAVSESTLPRDDLSARELFAILDEELERLPERYREPLVLCYLEGLSREDAAARLGVPGGTVKTRLERGRRRLEDALTRRGVGAGLGFLALAIAPLTRASTRCRIDSILAAISRPSPTVSALARGTIMTATHRKALVVVAVLGAALSAVGSMAAPGAPRMANPTPSAPAALTLQSADQKFQEIDAARAKAIEFLRKQQKDGKWEGNFLNFLTDMEGGVTALVALCLLESGVPTNDPAVTKAIEYLAKLEPKKTYVVSLQTQVLARADPKAHKEQIQKNVDWLLKEAIQMKNRLEGWSYPANTIADNSNTHFAVVALHAAKGAGAKIDAKVWEQIREFYTRTQSKTGGWGYYNGTELGVNPLSFSMTTCGLVGLAVAAKHHEDMKEPGEAFKLGMAKLLAMEAPTASKSDGYLWMATAELGRLLDKTEFKAGDKGIAWYREGAEKLLKTQKEDGSWAWAEKGGIDAYPVLTTAFGLYFLGPPKKK